MNRADLDRIFSDIYRQRLWGDGESTSGPGSGLERTAQIRADITALVRRLGVRSLLDAGCGDFHWMPAVLLEIDSYIGVDVVRELVKRNRQCHHAAGCQFEHVDITRDRLPTVDLILCRDVLPHLSLSEATEALGNFRQSGSTWLLATTFVDRVSNNDIATGAWRPLNLVLEPFSLPTPTMLIDERCHHSGGIYADKRLGLWHLASGDLATISAVGRLWTSGGSLDRAPY